ncbi:hypothetical protein LOTGIDRAFT_106137 [Lottia gigantea]|uniref:Anti-proliferative protein domain-containing protein n=1 Tax=Lottia gigantea TaxID=225164 RepID=V4A2I3_LOTGI|nr:hypothetical protein LOTGIDRAFT_106137 [Lottia gigantea]ESO89150.1 hypothetical protein LOTGIDRAFT_106137 [Lottia gigantea]
MHVEVSVALNFVISYLYSKLPRRRVDMLADELERGLKKKFEGHWYPDMPCKGSGYRCVKVNGEKVDPVILMAAYNVGLDADEIKNALPAELTVWIDPSEVSYRIGEKGVIKILYSEKKPEEDLPEPVDSEIMIVSKGFNPEAQCFKPIDSLSSSLSNLSLSPSSPISSVPHTNFNIHKERVAPKFTAASFAATKFGSTKPKTHVKRPTRLSPTEFGNFFRQKTSPSEYMPQRPRSLSPRDPRVEFMIDQQHRMLMTQNRQQLHPYSAQSPTASGAAFLNDFYQHQSPTHLSPTHQVSPQSSLGLNLPDVFSSQSPTTSLSPDVPKSLLDSFNQNNVSYQNHLQQLLLAN